MGPSAGVVDCECIAVFVKEGGSLVENQVAPGTQMHNMSTYNALKALTITHLRSIISLSRVMRQGKNLLSSDATLTLPGC